MCYAVLNGLTVRAEYSSQSRQPSRKRVETLIIKKLKSYRAAAARKALKSHEDLASVCSLDLLQ